MSFVSKLAGHFGQKSGLIGQWPADTVLKHSHKNETYSNVTGYTNEYCTE